MQSVQTVATFAHNAQHCRASLPLGFLSIYLYALSV